MLDPINFRCDLTSDVVTTSGNIVSHLNDFVRDLTGNFAFACFSRGIRFYCGTIPDVCAYRNCVSYRFGDTDAVLFVVCYHKL